MVLAWGNVELHSLGFRSEWQRVVGIAKSSPDLEWPRDRHLAEVVERYGCRVVDRDALEQIAIESGDQIPIGLVPISPLELLTVEGAWWTDIRRGDRYFSGGDLHDRIRAGSALARREMAVFGVDIAARAALRGRGAIDPDKLARLDDALIGLLAAVETWRPAPRAHQGKPGVRAFRAHAASLVDAVLGRQRVTEAFEAPTTITFAHIQELVRQLIPDGCASTAAAPRRRYPLKERQIRPLVLAIAQTGTENDFLIDGLERVAATKTSIEQELWDGGRPDWKFARELYEAGSRSTAVTRALIWRYGRKQRTEQLEEIAKDPAVHPHRRAQALEAIAFDSYAIGPVLAALAHPLCDWLQAEQALVSFGGHGRRHAREILERGVNTDAQLAACIQALGDSAAAAAFERLNERPAASFGLVGLCCEVLSGEQFANLLSDKIATGEVLAEPWFRLIDERPRSEQRALVERLLARIMQEPDPPWRAKLLRCFDHTAATVLPDDLYELVHDAVINDPELPDLPQECPACGSNARVPIRYGLPGAGLVAATPVRAVQLGGCVVSFDSPNRACRLCGERWLGPPADWPGDWTPDQIADANAGIADSPARLAKGFEIGPVCAECGGLMRRAGSGYKCESCGYDTGGNQQGGTSK